VDGEETQVGDGGGVNIAKHIYWAIRYGEWHCGCEFYKGKPMIGIFYAWHDGNNIGAHLGPLWIGCQY